MDLKLIGKRVLVTGSSEGIGAVVARTLAKEGGFVVLHGLNRGGAEEVAKSIAEAGGQAVAIHGDLRSDHDAERIAAEATAVWGGIDILINNAGTYHNRGWNDATPAQWLETYNVNVVSMVRLVLSVAPGMKRLKWGRIINLASGEAAFPFAFMPDYAATKAAIVNLTVSLSKELAGTGITVNTVSPGIIITDGVQNFFQQMAMARGWPSGWEEIKRHVLSEVLPNTVGRLGVTDDVADLITFLSSPLSGYINGANYRIDGGSTPCIN